MPLSKTTIKNAIRPVMEANLNNNDPADSRDSFLNAMADAITAAIKEGVETATITPVLIAPGGSGGPVTGDITITIQIVE
jgi:hypothetical protein